MVKSFKKGFFKTLLILKDYLGDIVIAGGWVPLIYYHYLLHDKEREPLRTKDIDLVVPERLRKKGRTVNELLKEAGFKPVFKSMDTPPFISYQADITGIEVEIEFLTDQRGRKESAVIEVQTGLHAQSLRYIYLLLKNTLLVEIDDFPLEKDTLLKVKVPTPGAFIFHKGLIFPRRTRNRKRAKDLYYIFDILANCPELGEQIIDALSKLKKIHISWFKRFLKNLKEYFPGITPKGVYLIYTQRPEGAFPNLDDAQFNQYVLEIFQRFISQLESL